MKIKEDLLLRNIAGRWVIVPMGERLLEFNGMSEINDSGAFIWNLLVIGCTKEDIIAALLEEYDIDEATAAVDVVGLIKTLSDANMLEA